MEIIQEFGKIAGIAGIGLGVFLFLFKDIIAKNIFPEMTSEQGYKTIRLLIFLVWSIAIAGLGVWAFFEYLKTSHKPESSQVVPSNNQTENNPKPEKKEVEKQNEKKQPSNSNSTTKKQPDLKKTNDKVVSEPVCRILTNSKYSQAQIFIERKQSVLLGKYGNTKVIKLPFKPDRTYLITLILGMDTIYSKKHLMKLDTNDLIISGI